MPKRGFEPKTPVQVSHDPGEDFDATFILPDGSVVCCEFCRDRQTGQVCRILALELLDEDCDVDDQYSLAIDFLKDPLSRESFDAAVRMFPLS